MQRSVLSKEAWQVLKTKIRGSGQRGWAAISDWFKHQYRRIRENRLGIGYIALVMLLIFFPVASGLGRIGNTHLNQNTKIIQQAQISQEQSRLMASDLGLIKQQTAKETTKETARTLDASPTPAVEQPAAVKAQVHKGNSPPETDSKPAKAAAPASTAMAKSSAAVSFCWPVQGKVVLAYGWQKDPVFNDYRLHSGIDIAAKAGTLVKAAADGQVTRVYEDAVLGKTVVIAHGAGQTTTYAHCGDFKVKAGESIAGGAAVATVGNSGIVDNPQLYFEVRVNGKTVDPDQILP